MMANSQITTRIGFLVISSLVTLGLLLGLATLGLDRIDRATADLNAYRAIFEQTTNIEWQVGQMRQKAAAFLSERDAAAAHAVSGTISTLAIALSELQASPEGRRSGSGIGELARTIIALEERFQALVERAGALGFDPHSGLCGQLTRSAAVIEDELAAWPNLERLMVPMQAMRLNEKNYLIYHDPGFLGPHRKAQREFDFKLGAAAIDANTRRQLAAALVDYQRAFATFVDADHDYRLEVASFSQALHELEPRFILLREGAREGMNAAVASQRATRDQVVFWCLTVGGLMAGGFILCAVLVALSITRPLRAIKDSMVRLAEGETGVCLPGVKRRDEIGAMARAVRAFMNENERLRLIQQRQQRQTEQLLERFQGTTAQLQAVLDAARQMAIIACDPEGRILLFNRGAETLLGWSAGQVVGRASWLDFHLAEEVALRAAELSHSVGTPVAPAALFAEYVRRGQFAAREWTWQRHDGSRFPVSLSMTPILGADGALTGYLAAAMDITERKWAEQEAHKARAAADAANQAKSNFLANMSHELRTPLNAIIGYSEMLQEELGERGLGELVDDLGKIHGAGRHLLALINDILDISKIEAGRMELYLETFDFAALVAEVEATVQPLMAQNHNTLTVHCPAGIGPLHADLTKVRETLFNLLSNATKFTDHGRISLSASREPGNWLAIAVSDNGIGMTREQQACLFEAFRQADASTTRKYGGTGLGLAISRTFCRMMGGDITVNSEPGVGSTFTVHLPLVVTEPQAAAAAQAALAAGPDAGATAGIARPVVLVIDDDALARDLLGRLLSEHGFQPRFAADGPAGIALARTLKPAAITLDVMMPEMDGWAILSELKADPALAAVPVIMVSMVDHQALGYALGAHYFVSKPVDRSQLAGVLERIRASHELETILVVEDDRNNREMLRRMLSRDGWSVLEAANGRLALKQIAQAAPDLILLDLMMPEMDGFQLAAELRRHQTWRSIPIVVLTAKDLSQDERASLAGSVAEVLQKGEVDKDDLLAELKRLVQPPAPLP